MEAVQLSCVAGTPWLPRMAAGLGLGGRSGSPEPESEIGGAWAGWLVTAAFPERLPVEQDGLLGSRGEGASLPTAWPSTGSINDDLLHLQPSD